MITHKGITCPLKFLEKMTEKCLFLQFFLTNLQEKSHVIWEFLIVYINNAIVIYSMSVMCYFSNKKKIHVWIKVF